MMVLPQAVGAQAIELNQTQLRQLVVQQQVLSSEQVVGDVAANFGGAVQDIRAFFYEGRMAYRILLKRADGQIVEVLVNGQNGEQISPDTPLGQIVSAVARSTNGRSIENSNRGQGNNNRGGNGRGNSGGNGRGNSDGGGNGNGKGNGN